MHQPMQAAGAMAPKPEKPSQGWGFPALTNKAHYFIGGRALCGGWMFAGELEDARHDHADNCLACMKKRAKLAP